MPLGTATLKENRDPERQAPRLLSPQEGEAPEDAAATAGEGDRVCARGAAPGGPGRPGLRCPQSARAWPRGPPPLPPAQAFQEGRDLRERTARKRERCKGPAGREGKAGRKQGRWGQGWRRVGPAVPSSWAPNFSQLKTGCNSTAYVVTSSLDVNDNAQRAAGTEMIEECASSTVDVTAHLDAPGQPCSRADLLSLRTLSR